MIEWKQYDNEDEPAFNSIFLINATIEKGRLFKSSRDYQCLAVKKGTGWFDCRTEEWIPNVTHYAEINLPLKERV